MRRLGLHLLSTLLALAPTFGGFSGSLTATAHAQSMPMPMNMSKGCGLSEPAFCDTFDEPFSGGGRTGQMNPNRWSIARVSGVVNADQNKINEWIPSPALHCRTPISGVVPDQDYFMC